ncbi:MAG TPA: HAMP domain-containing histidine kinase [Candidatus Mediterraneibacter faecigallinarum]|uniref:histidine kinase n=1 Tax=Candidatus Mediterraneibacter faecigallinarum TaxID=2838669 RepID=A0A9D2NTS3_9FIRM|nr:HAMP domain-containing histidine kinase [Candidatus Mediterraneibacter faecigallinarum]
MKNYKRRKRLIPAVFAVLLLLMAAGTCLFAWEVRQDYEEGLKSMIGRLYEEDQESAEQMMGWLFEGERGGAVEKGEEALTALGYTDKGAEYLYEQSRLYTFSAGMVCVEILAGIALLILFVWMERLREEREEELVRRIRSGEMAPAASGREQPEEPADGGSQSDGAVQPEEPEQALEYEIAKLFERLEAEEHYLQEKNLMTQNFIENIAHQIKTPLSCISISQERILEGTEGEARELAQQSLRYTDEIGKLMKRLLDIGRLEAGKVIWHREMFRMADLLEDCAASLEDGTERILTMGDREAEYYGDYEWLKEAFSNILKNCLEHDASGEKITASLTQSREGIKIVIRDHGPGISEKDLPHIFDRFYLPEKTGTSHVGIGLNLARLVIEQHFGTVAARNAEGGGAEFTVILPAYSIMKTERI